MKDDPASAIPPAKPSTSFEDLFRTHYLPMVRLAHLLTGSNLAAEDLVQDAFVRVQRAWAQVVEPVPYLRAAVVNACRSWHRQRRREAARLMLASREQMDLSPPTIELLDALQPLPWGQRTALVLRFYGDLSERQIAEAMRCRPGTVKSHLHRGLAALRKAIEP